MAVTLTLSAPTTTDVTLSAGNAKAETIIDDFLEAQGDDVASMTDQEKVDAFMQHIRVFIVSQHASVGMARQVAAARAAYAPQDWTP